MGLKADIGTAIQANTTVAQRNRIVAAFSSAYGYLATLPDGNANPETNVQFAARKIAEYIMNTVQGEEYKALHTAVVLPTAIPVN